jgi:hypothetical protein
MLQKGSNEKDQKVPIIHAISWVKNFETFSPFMYYFMYYKKRDRDGISLFFFWHNIKNLLCVPFKCPIWIVTSNQLQFWKNTEIKKVDCDNNFVEIGITVTILSLKDNELTLFSVFIIDCGKRCIIIRDICW